MSATNFRRISVTNSRITDQDSADHAVRSRGFVVASIDAMGNFSMAANPVVHTSEMSAAAECDRLSGMNPGKTYVFLRFVGGRRVPTSKIVL